jgi:hypothetical protein
MNSIGAPTSCWGGGGNSYLISEWTGGVSRGRIDFLVREANWAVELLKDGSNLSEYVERSRVMGGGCSVAHESRILAESLVLELRVLFKIMLSWTFGGVFQRRPLVRFSGSTFVQLAY